MCWIIVSDVYVSQPLGYEITDKEGNTLVWKLKNSQRKVKELPKGDLLVIRDILICVQLYWESH